jgi:hypothetical protein
MECAMVVSKFEDGRSHDEELDLIQLGVPRNGLNCHSLTNTMPFFLPLISPLCSSLNSPIYQVELLRQVQVMCL